MHGRCISPFVVRWAHKLEGTTRIGKCFFNFRFIPPCLRSYINAIVYAKKTCSLYLIIWDTVYPLWILKHPLKVKKNMFL
jgi:hypothetical protein